MPLPELPSHDLRKSRDILSHDLPPSWHPVGVLDFTVVHLRVVKLWETFLKINTYLLSLGIPSTTVNLPREVLHQ